MDKREKRKEQGRASPEGGRRPTVGDAGGGHIGALKNGQRWTMARKREVVLRIFRGESIEALSRELGVEMYRLEEWRDQAMFGMDAGLRTRKTDPLQLQLDQVHRRLGEALMDNELLRERHRRQGIPLPRGRSKK